MDQFGFFYLIKSYVETTKLIDEIFISKEASCTAQKVPGRLKFLKLCVKRLNFVLMQRF